jgi:hypothetical protein
MPIVRVELTTDTRVDVILRRLSRLVRSYPGNDEFELILHAPEGLKVFSPHQGVDSWDPRLRTQLKETLADL